MAEAEVINPGQSSPIEYGTRFEDDRVRDAILARLMGQTHEEAAEAGGMSLRTYYYVLRTDRYQELKREVQRDLVDLSRGRLVGMMSKALDKLDGLLDNPATPAPTVLAAVTAILDRAAVISGPADDKQITRILTHLPPKQTPTQLTTHTQEPSEETPEGVGIPSHRRSVMRERLERGE